MSDASRYLVWVGGRPLHPGQPLTPQEAAAHFVDQADLADPGTLVEVCRYSDDDLADDGRPSAMQSLGSGSSDRYVVWIDGLPLHPDQAVSAQEVAGHFVAQAERADHSTIVEVHPWNDNDDGSAATTR